jgi:hypothetical protein
MNKQSFFRSIWNDIEEYVRRLLGHVIKILLTIGSLKLIIIVLSLLFTEKPIIIKYIEAASHMGILIIFIIYIAVDIYTIMEEKLKGGNTDERQ